MAQESKVMEGVAKANEQTKSKLKELYVSRQRFNDVSENAEEDKALYSYFIDAEFRGQPQRISLSPEDNGSYSLLNIIFAGEDKARARLVESVFKPTEDSEPIISYNVEVYVVDDGIEYSAPFKGQRKSDKTCLNILNAQIKAAKKK